MKEQFFFLLRSGIGFTDEKPVGFPLRENEWIRIWKQAMKQTVCGLIFAGIEKLPKDMQPHKNLLMEFLTYTEKIKRSNLMMRSVAEEITGWFEAERLEPIVIKGLSVGALYPIPELRMPGDIDLFFHKDYGKVVPIVNGKGIDVTLDPNHDKFTYKDIPIELHHTAFRALYSIKDTDFSPISFDGDGYKGRILNIKANAILLLIHPARHFMAGGIGFRHLCDWALFLKKYEESPELWAAWKEVKRQGAGRFAVEFTAIAIHYLGLKLKYPERWTGESKTKLREKMLHLIMKRGNFAKSLRARTSFTGYYLRLMPYYFQVYPFWKQFIWMNVPKKIGYSLVNILRGKSITMKKIRINEYKS